MTINEPKKSFLQIANEKPVVFDTLDEAWDTLIRITEEQKNVYEGERKYVGMFSVMNTLFYFRTHDRDLYFSDFIDGIPVRIGPAF